MPPRVSGPVHAGTAVSRRSTLPGPRARQAAAPGSAAGKARPPEPPVDLEVDRLSADGEGIARWRDRALFVPGVLPGEQVRVVPGVEGKVQRGHLLEVLRPAPDRVAPGCPLAGTCGGCDWLHLAPDGRRREREQAVRAALERLGGLDLSSVEWLPTLSAGDLGTRRRADLHWTGSALGYLGRRTHTPVPVEHCPALVGPLAALPGQLTPLLSPLGRSLRAVRLLAEGDRVSVALELVGAVRPRAREVALAIVRSGVRGVALVPEQGGVEDVGRPTLRSPAPLRPEVMLRLRPEVFAQAHGEGTPLLVQRAVELLAPSSGDAALELHAGNGTFTFTLAGRVASVIAVESSAAAIRLASSASTEAGLGNVRFVQGDADKVSRGLVKEGRRFDLLLADPPRTGAPGLGALARDLGVRRVVYVACEAGALARDAADLVKAGLGLRTLQLVDMFPGTHHAETLAVFEGSRQRPEAWIQDRSERQKRSPSCAPGVHLVRSRTPETQFVRSVVRRVASSPGACGRGTAHASALLLLPEDDGRRIPMRCVLVPLALIAIGCGSSSGDTSICDTLATVTNDLNAKAAPCTSTAPSLDFDAAACRSSISLCSDSDRQKIQDFASCLQALPTCTPATSGAWTTSFDACQAKLGSLAGQGGC